MPARRVPVTDLVDRAVYTADGVRLGRVVDVVVDLEAPDRPAALAVGDVAEDAVGALPEEATGVRVPWRFVRGAGEILVLRPSAREAAFPLPGGELPDAAARGHAVEATETDAEAGEDAAARTTADGSGDRATRRRSDDREGVSHIEDGRRGPSQRPGGHGHGHGHGCDRDDDDDPGDGSDDDLIV